MAARGLWDPPRWILLCITVAFAVYINKIVYFNIVCVHVWVWGSCSHCRPHRGAYFPF